MNNKVLYIYIYTFILCRPSIFLLAPLLPRFSLNISKRRTNNKNKHMWGWNPQKPAKQDGNDTAILSQNRYILPTIKLYMHINLITPSKLIHINKALGTAHSTIFAYDSPYLPCLLTIKLYYPQQTYSPCRSTCSITPSTAFHNPPCTQLNTRHIVGKMAKHLPNFLRYGNRCPGIQFYS